MVRRLGIPVYYVARHFPVAIAATSCAAHQYMANGTFEDRAFEADTWQLEYPAPTRTAAHGRILTTW
jgi:hypothetical protein